MDILDNEQRDNELLLKKYNKIITTTQMVILAVCIVLLTYTFCDYWAQRQQAGTLPNTVLMTQLHDPINGTSIFDLACVFAFIALFFLSYKKPVVAFSVLLLPAALCSYVASGHAYRLLKYGYKSTYLTPAQIPFVLIWWPLLIFLVRGIIAVRKRKRLEKKLLAEQDIIL